MPPTTSCWRSRWPRSDAGVRRLLPLRPLPADRRRRPGLPGSTDAWTTLAGTGPGHLHDPPRHPGHLGDLPAARAAGDQVAQVDQMSGGRVELGLGTGWFDAEHVAYGIPFPPVGERFGRFEEQLEILIGLWTTPAGETFSFEGAPLPAGRLAGAAQARAEPQAADHHRRHRRRRAPRAWSPGSPTSTTCRSPHPGRHREGASTGSGGRARWKAGSRRLRFSVAQTICVGSDDAEIARRAEVIGQDLDDAAARPASTGTPAEVTEKIGHLAETGRRTGLPAGAGPGRPRPPGAHRLADRDAAGVT